MKHYKKIILTLVALLAVTTGAWTTPNSIVINGTPQVGDKSISLTYHFDPANVPGITSFAPTLKVKCAADNKWDETNLSLHEVSSGTTIISLSNLGEFEAGKTYEVCFAYNNGNWVDEVFQSFVPAGPATFPFPITWDATNKTTGFNLPAGNVFMNVEYYPVAAVATAPAAKSDIKATTDDAIVTAGTVAKIGETENAQGTLMYYAVQSETAPEAPDYDNQGWSDKVPTAADFNQGNVYVWYYVKGADGDAESTFNDGAITKLGETGYVTLAAPPTYAITLAEGTEEVDKWTISPAEATKGTTITATYTGTKKVIGMTVTKRASLVYPIVISEVTDEAYIGSVVADDGYVYATIDDVDKASKTPVAKICYVGSETGDATYKHGLALALRDVSDTKQWCPASKKCLDSQYTTVAEAKGDLAGIANTDVLVGHTGHTHDAASAARGYNSGTHPKGTSAWFLPSVGQWDKMVTAVGDYGKLGLNSGNYWSSTEVDAENAWSVNGGSWSTVLKHYYQGVRACLAF